MTAIKLDQSQRTADPPDDPIVTVVTPTYNHAETLPRAIESVLDQTFEDFEYIIVDDASTDNTKSVVEPYDDDRIHYVRNEENKGGSAARNTGITKARGRYVAFLDADDEWLPGKLAAQVECLEERTEDWVAVYCDVVSERRGGERYMRWAVTQALRTIGQTPPEPNVRCGGERLVREILTKRLSVAGGTTLMVRTETARHINGFDAAFYRHQDLEFLVRVLKQGKLAFVNEPFATVYDSSAPNPGSLELTKMQYFGKFIADVQRLEAEGDSVLGPHWYSLSKLYFKKGYFQKGSQYLLGANIQSAQQLLGIGYAITIGIYSCINNFLSRP
jgi:glycosyltransferase involved in cell wall biosynthesis